MAHRKSSVHSSGHQPWKYRTSLMRLFFISIVASVAFVAVRSGNVSGWNWSFRSQRESGELWKVPAEEELVNRFPKEVMDVILANTNGSSLLALDLSSKRNFSPSWVYDRTSEAEKLISESGPSKDRQNLDYTEKKLSNPVTFISGLMLTDSKQLKAAAESTVVESKLTGKDSHTPNPKKVLRKQLRHQRKENRVRELIQQDKQTLDSLQSIAIMKTQELGSAVRSKYSIWRRDTENMKSDSTVKLIRDQIIMAKVYASIAKGKRRHDIYNQLMNHVKESQKVLGEANFDSDLPNSALRKIKVMAEGLAAARTIFSDCGTITRKLRAMLQTSEEHIKALKKQTTFLSQLAAKSTPKSLHCLTLQLTVDYSLLPHEERNFPHQEKLENPSLYHYALFSDNVLAAAVVVNSTVLNAKNPEKHVFHLVTDKLNYGAMKMWFLSNPPGKAAITVENVDEFKWLNSSYSPVLRQLESAALKEYYFKSDQPTTLEAGYTNLKYRNPKYLSVLNHLRFYLPQIYPKLDKILFLDDDIVVQRDLTPLWSIDLKGKVNGAVETCGESFHRFDTYLNFSNPHIARNFDPNACGWAFGMNIFDLKQWKRRDITSIYHKWQSMNEDRTLWKLGSLPPGLITFYNLTFPVNSSWHVLGLGYDSSVELSAIEDSSVAHYNGNMKPWLDLAIQQFRPYWTKYVKFDHPYIQQCNIS